MGFILLAILSEVIAVNKNNAQVEAGRVRYLSYAIADEFRHSSMVLTRLARTYAATGGNQYFDLYFAIVDWKNGKPARPSNVNVNVELYPNKTKAQKDIMRELNFSQQELDLMEQAGKFSNELINTETQAMKSIRQLKFVSSPFTITANESLKEFALRILFDEKYHAEVKKSWWQWITARVNLI